MPRPKQIPPEKPDMIPVVLATFILADICLVLALFSFYYLMSLNLVGPEKRVDQIGQIVWSVVGSLIAAALIALFAYITRRIRR